MTQAKRETTHFFLQKVCVPTVWKAFTRQGGSCCITVNVWSSQDSSASGALLWQFIFNHASLRRSFRGSKCQSVHRSANHGNIPTTAGWSGVKCCADIPRLSWNNFPWSLNFLLNCQWDIINEKSHIDLVNSPLMVSPSFSSSSPAWKHFVDSSHVTRTKALKIVINDVDPNNWWLYVCMYWL